MQKSDIEQLYNQYGSSLYKRAQFLLRNEQEANDILQDVFVAVVKHSDSFRQESSPYTWLYRITTNLCLNRIQKNKKFDLFDIIKTKNLPIESTEDQPHTKDWEKFVEKLDNKTQQVLVYRYTDDLGQEEIAELMGITRKTVYNYLEKISARYKKFLGEHQ